MNKDDYNANEELCCRLLFRKRERGNTGAYGGEGEGDGGEDGKVVGGGEGTVRCILPGHLRALRGKILLHICQILHLLFVSLITNIIDFVKTKCADYVREERPDRSVDASHYHGCNGEFNFNALIFLVSSC